MNKLLLALAASAAAAVLSLPATDDFLGAVATCDLGDATCPHWTAISGTSNAWGHSGGVQGAIAQNATADDIVYWNADVFTADQYSQITAEPGVSAGYIGPAVRLTSGPNGYAFGCGTHTIYKFVAGVRSDLDTSHASCADGDLVKLEVTGTSTTSLVVKINGAQDGSTYNDSSSPFTSGSAGMWGYPSTPGFVLSWTGGDLGGPPPSTFPPGIVNFPIRCCAPVVRFDR